MRTLKKIIISLLISLSFTACYPLLRTHGYGWTGRYYYNNQSYESGRDYRQARRQGRNSSYRNSDNSYDSRGSGNNNNQREGR